MVFEAGKERLAEAVGKTHYANPDPFIGSNDPSIAFGGKAQRAEVDSGCGTGSIFQKRSAG
jgi:hypothetical protein